MVCSYQMLGRVSENFVGNAHPTVHGLWGENGINHHWEMLFVSIANTNLSRFAYPSFV